MRRRRRKVLRGRKNRALFARSARRVNKRNLGRALMRGGYRL